MTPARTPEELALLNARRKLVKYLMGEVCRCRGPKKAGMTFCSECVKLCPAKDRANLWRKIGEGFEGPYGRCCAAIDAARAGKAGGES
jgi:hypothetical protein